MATKPRLATPPPGIDYVLDKLRWMQEQRIWPTGLRYLWTDAFGLVLLVSLHRELGEKRYLHEAEWLVAEVERVLGRTRGIRIGEAPRSRRPIFSLSRHVAVRTRPDGRIQI